MRFLFAVAVAFALLAQQPPAPAEKEVVDFGFFCPMDKDIRSKGPGKCGKCGMKLIPEIADPVEYPVNLRLTPRVVKPGAPVDMEFRIENPADGKTVEKFEIVHEKLFHLFLVSEDLSFFAHEHPEYTAGGLFRFRTALPKPGPYRVVTDFFPVGGTPQMNTSTVYVAGKLQKPRPLEPDLTPQKAANLEASLATEPLQPLAGFKTLMFFTLKPLEGDLKLEQYLGAWGHMLAASNDLIDLVHTHPFIADGGPKVQFNMIFPREGIYRVWVQFQNNGEVNTLAFNVPVKQLR